MKGLLDKTHKGWVVLYTECVPHRMTMEWTSSLPLHPNDQELMKGKDSSDFIFREVEFEIGDGYAKQITLIPRISDDFQIGPDGAYEHEEPEQQSAVEWLIEQLMERGFQEKNYEILKQAKEMEYKQTMDAIQKGMELEQKYSSKPSFRERNGLTTPKHISPKDQNKMSFGELSDDEIEKAAMETMDHVYLNPNDSLLFHQGWMRAIKWYKEQLKK